MSDELVLVTGGSGFIGAHCILRLLEAGYRVRTTVRSLEREADVRAMLKEGGAEPGEALAFVAADLMSDAGWPEAVAGCGFVLHVASPFPRASRATIRADRPGPPGRPARPAGGARRRRQARRDDLVVCGHRLRPQADRPALHRRGLDRPDDAASAYVKSKTLAERAAWDFVAREGGALELAVVNPVGVLGPVLGPDLSTSIQLVKQSLDGAMPGTPRLYFDIVDVRDVADLHLRAMTDPAAKGERFLAVADGP